MIAFPRSDSPPPRASPAAPNSQFHFFGFCVLWWFGWSASCPAVLSSDLKRCHAGAHTQGGTQRHARRRVPVSSSVSSALYAAMDLEAKYRACVELRVKLRRDTGVNLTAAVCEGLLNVTFEREGGERVSLLSDPWLFYTSLGAAIADQTLPLILPDRLKVAAWCYREAAEVHAHPEGMRRLFGCLDTGQGVTEDPTQAVLWLEKAVDLGDAAAKSALGSHLMIGDARAGASCIPRGMHSLWSAGGSSLYSQGAQPLGAS